jgi:P-type Ca2+ transporter type 2C
MWYTMPLGEVLKKLRSDLNTGLREEQIEDIRKIYGENKLSEKKKESIIIKFFKQFNDFMIIILIVASIISAVMSYVEGKNDYLDSVIIILIVVVNAIMGVVQEAKAEKSLEALKKMSAPTAKVKRNGVVKTVQSTELVPGDYIIIEAGSYIPADSRLIKSYNLKVEESSLTGETVPVLKDEKAIVGENTPIGDIVNMVWGATIAVSRTCRSNSNKCGDGH